MITTNVENIYCLKSKENANSYKFRLLIKGSENV
jgi:hypothetical protein